MLEDIFLYYSKTEKRKKILTFLVIGFLLALIAGFAATTALIITNNYPAFDFSIINIVHSKENQLLTQIMKLVSSFGYFPTALIGFIAFASWLYTSNYRQEFAFSFFVWLAPIISQLAKITIGRPRPLLEINIYPAPGDFSFPSGHVTFYSVFFGLIAFWSISLPRIHPIIRLILLLISITLIAFVGLSRIYLGLHWPTDVLAGYFLGFALLELLIITYTKYLYLPNVREEKNKTNNKGKKGSK